MIQKIKGNSVQSLNRANLSKSCSLNAVATNPIPQGNLAQIPKTSVVNQPNTNLNEAQKQKYLYLLDFLKNTPQSPNSPELTPFGQLDLLLKNGKLLSKSNHDNSTVLDNLYEIATVSRAQGFDKNILITGVLDVLSNPGIVTQTFGDIPAQIQKQVLDAVPDDSPVKKNPQIMNVVNSGTCPAASLEVNMANNYPAELARWINKLTSEAKTVQLNVDLKAISKNPLEAINILNLLKANKVSVNFNKAKVQIKLDKDAHIRACIQSQYWDQGERTPVDVIIQSAIMELGSQNTYDALSDTRAGEFSSNPQGLIELEKTFAETMIKNKEITSLVYQQIDDNQNLVGYNCSMDKIAKHITDTIDSGDNVILGYVLTNETAGLTSNPNYNPTVDGPKNKVINGHEITIVDYYKDDKGKYVFICVDTDDDSPQLVQYSADWLLPKIHHAGYPAKLVEADEKTIMKYSS